ncbi:hypothetical protein ACXYN8_07725 [Altererythrobacter sp. CAU 1778]
MVSDTNRLLAKGNWVSYLKLMSYRMSGKTPVAGCALMLAAFILLPMLYIGGGAYTEALPRPFNWERWKAVDHWGDTRCAMIADLRTRIEIEGKTREELTDLLGPDENEASDASLSHWHLCPSFMDVWILEVRWKDGIAQDSWVRDT